MEEIKKKLRKYKKVGKPQPYPKCELCGCKLVKDKYWVCPNCGLVQDVILIANKKRRSEGMDYKFTREKEWNRKIHKLLSHREYMKDYMRKEAKKKSQIYIIKEVHKRLISYCEEKKIVQYAFVSGLIMETLDLLELEEFKNG